MAWGMPLPCDPAKKVRAAQAHSMKPTGVSTSANQGLNRRCANRFCARFAAQAKATLTMPTAMAPPQSTSRIFQWRRDSNSTR